MANIENEKMGVSQSEGAVDSNNGGWQWIAIEKRDIKKYVGKWIKGITTDGSDFLGILMYTRRKFFEIKLGNKNYIIEKRDVKTIYVEKV